MCVVDMHLGYVTWDVYFFSEQRRARARGGERAAILQNVSFDAGGGSRRKAFFVVLSPLDSENVLNIKEDLLRS